MRLAFHADTADFWGHSLLKILEAKERKDLEETEARDDCNDDGKVPHQRMRFEKSKHSPQPHGLMRTLPFKKACPPAKYSFSLKTHCRSGAQDERIPFGNARSA